MPYSIDRLYTAARAPLHVDAIRVWQQSLQAHHDGQTSVLARGIDTVGLVALAGQAQLCQTSVFVHLDTFCGPRPVGVGGLAAPRPVPEAIGPWAQDVMSGRETRFVAAAGAVAGRIGATLVVVGQLLVSAIWLGITLAVGLMTAVYRAAWAGMFTATPMPVGLVPLVTTPSDGSDTSGPSGSRRARRIERTPSSICEAPPTPDARRGMFSACTRGNASALANLPRLAKPEALRRGRTQTPWQTPKMRRALQAGSQASRTQVSSALQMRFVWPEPVGGTQGQCPLRRSNIRQLVQALGHRPVFAHLGLQGPGHPGPSYVSLDLLHFQHMFVLAGRAQHEALTLMPSVLAAVEPRITWLEDAPLESNYVRVPRTTPDNLPTPSEIYPAPGVGHNVVETLMALWHRLGAEHRRTSAESPDIALAAAQSRRRWPLAGLQRSRSEPWSQNASIAWRNERRAAGVDEAFVRVLRPTPPSTKTLTGPRLNDESLETFLQRLRDDGRDASAYAGGGEAFLAMVRALHAQNEALEPERPQQTPGPLGLHPQFIKDLPRAAFYIYPNGPGTQAEDAFEVNQSLAGQWNKALNASVNVQACAPLLSTWLDKLLPLDRGLLREDVTLEATQAGLAAACEAVQRSAQPGLLITPTDQKSIEFVLWSDDKDGRVHIVGMVQYGSMMVMNQDGDADDNQTPLYPYRVHVHLSVGARADRNTPRDVVVHEGNWSTVAPW